MSWSYNSNGSCINCKCVPDIGPPTCTSPLTIFATSACKSPQPGVIITITRLTPLPSVVVATGTTDGNGKYEVFLPVGSYRVDATHKGFNPVSAFGSGSHPGGDSPIARVVTCSGTVTFTFDSFDLAVYVNGCQFADQPGASVQVYKAIPHPTSPFLRLGWDLIGSGSSGGDGLAYIELNKPNNRDSQIVLKVEHGDFYQHLKPLNQFNGVVCSQGVSINQLGVPASNYPDLPGVDLTPRTSTSNAKAPTSCCNSLQGPKPLPGTLNATIGPYNCELTNHDLNGVWYGYFQAVETGRVAYQATVTDPQTGEEITYWTTTCGTDPYQHVGVQVCVLARWACGGLGLTMSVCNIPNAFVPLGVDCQVWRQYFTESTRALTVGGVDVIQGNPLLETGTCYFGPYTVTE